MIIAVVEKLLNVVLAGKSKFDKLCFDGWMSTLPVADGYPAAVLGDVRYQYEEL